MRILSGVIVSAILVSLSLSLVGCAGQGQTAVEQKRARIRTRTADIQAMQDDAERVFLLDEPSNLTPLSVR
jgi:hypothetical protein